MISMKHDSAGAFASLLQSMPDPTRPTLLFGSVARGDQTSDSDIDMLQVSSRPTMPLAIGRIALTYYTADHLRYLAQSGSLFVLHLTLDGIILQDRGDLLAEILSAYTPPTSYEVHRRHVVTAAAALDVPRAVFETQAAGFLRLSRYLTRCLIYASCAEIGHPDFAILSATTRIGRPELAALFDRGAEPWPSFVGLRQALMDLGADVANSHGTIPALLSWLRKEDPTAWALVKSAVDGAGFTPYHVLGTSKGGS
jgi:hypothetical protein